jgi:NTE family protein
VKYSRIVCALSGGGAKAVAHLGVVKALEERGLEPTHYVGTSMGAVVGAMLASGLDYDACLRRVTGLSRRDVAQLAPGVLLGPLGRSVLREEPLRQTIARLVPAAGFAELRVPLTVTAVDTETSELVLFGTGGRGDVPLQEALYASCALPVYYPPALIGGRAYIDGGVRAVLPVEIADRQQPDLVVASYTGPQLAEPARGRPGRYGVLAAHDNQARILMAVQAEEVLARRDPGVPLLLVRPKVEARATFDITHAMQYIEEGYRAASRVVTEWQGALHSARPRGN